MELDDSVSIYLLTCMYSMDFVSFIIYGELGMKSNLT